MSPKTLLLVLLVLGATAVNFFWLRSIAPPTASEPLSAETTPNPLFPEGAVRPATTSDKAEIARLEELVAHLENQLKALSDENTSLIQKLGSIGMKPGATPLPSAGESSPGNAENGDYVSIGNELLKLRELQDLPIPTITTTEPELKEIILTWLKRIHTKDYGSREGAALHALGLIPESIDTLPARAALLARQITGWYDDTTETLQVIPPHKEPGGTLITTEPPLAIAYGNLLHHFADNLFGADYAALTSDERQARNALIGGDAALTRFLRELASPQTVNNNALPPDDPDHPLNQIVVPDYLRQRELFPLTAGFEFAQTLHSISSWPQVTAAYKRAPESTAEIMDTERYIGETRLPPTPIDLSSTTGKDVKPFWDDRLGQLTILLYLKRYLEPDAADQAAATWRGDRFLAYPAADGSARGHAFWRISTASPESARLLHAALKAAILFHYEQPEDAQLPLTTKTDNRTIHLTLDKSFVTLTDTASQEMAVTLQALK